MANIGSALTPDELAAHLRRAGAAGCTSELILEDIAAGAPAAPDGRMHIVSYIAWMEKRLGR